MSFLQYIPDMLLTERKRGAITEFLHAVKNGDKDNVFRRLHEITSVVGEDGVKIAKVKY